MINMKALVLVLLVTFFGDSLASIPPRCQVSEWGPWQPVPKYVGASHRSVPSQVTKERDSGRENMHVIKEMKRQLYSNPPQMKSSSELGLSGSKACSVQGLAGECSCKNVDQLSFVSFEDMGYDPEFIQDNWKMGNDIWGWTDPLTQDEYAIMCLSGGTAFVRITDHSNPKPLALMYSQTNADIWRDVKTIGNWAYVGAESTDHGMQIFDLTRLRGLDTFIHDIKPDKHYPGIGNSHNIVANEETEFIYVVGATDGDYQHCDGGLHVVDVKDPMNPVFAGCFDEDGYTHDAQCVIYRGPDPRYYKREICFSYNEDSLTIVDVTDKSDMKAVSKVTYNGAAYTHQGWMTEDQTMLLLDDEMDEFYGAERNTKTYIWDIHDLKNPVLVRTHYHQHLCTDHNQYIKGDLSFQTNYDCGLKIMYIDRENMDLVEVGHFDTTPDSSIPVNMGAWSNYPYYPSGNIAVSSIDYGLFVLKPDYDGLRRDFVSPTVQSTQTRYREILSAATGSLCPALAENRVLPAK